MKVFAVDPGTTESGYAVWDGSFIWGKGKVSNNRLLEMLSNNKYLNTVLVIEQIRSYGNAMGQSTIDTVFWSGRFAQAWCPDMFYLMPRVEVKKHICHNGNAKDTNVTQALVDRFAYGQRNYGKGTKACPGFFYGFKSDIWAAMGVAVTFFDQNMS